MKILSPKKKHSFILGLELLISEMEEKKLKFIKIYEIYLIVACYSTEIWIHHIAF